MGSGKGGQFQGECRRCGKWGHTEKDCWSKPKGGDQAQGSGQPKGGKAGGRGRGRGGKKGGKKGVGSMEEQDVAAEPEQEMGGIDLCSLSVDGMCQESDWDQYDEHTVLWRKYNLDTGAAVTVFPPSMAGESETKGP